MNGTNEQRARELLATAFDDAGLLGARDRMAYNQAGTHVENAALRAIAAALAEPKAGAVPGARHPVGGSNYGWEGEYNRGWNACRDAMLAAPQAKPCPCGEATCVEPWEPGCGLGTSAEHAVVATAAPQAQPSEETVRVPGEGWPLRFKPAEQQGQAVAWRLRRDAEFPWEFAELHELTAEKAEACRALGWEIEALSAAPQPAAVDALRVDDAMVMRAMDAYSEVRMRETGEGEYYSAGMGAALQAALSALGREGEVGRG